MSAFTLIDIIILAMSLVSIGISIYVLVDRHKTIKQREAMWKEKNGNDWA